MWKSFTVPETRVLQAADAEDLVIPACTVFSVPFLTFVRYRVILSIRSGKLSFHDWKSQGILLQKTCRNPRPNACWSFHTIRTGVAYVNGFVCITRVSEMNRPTIKSGPILSPTFGYSLTLPLSFAVDSVCLLPADIYTVHYYLFTTVQ